MSRIGKLSIILPQGVSLEKKEKAVVISGPKGSLEVVLPRGISIEVKEGQASVSQEKGEERRELHGTTRSLVANAIKGVSEGWSKVLELVGTGYRSEVSENTLVLTVGYSHPVKVEAPEGISFKVEKTLITVEGRDKEKVGQVAAFIRSIRAPEPYKGKGIKYQNEIIRRKAGKAAKTTTT